MRDLFPACADILWERLQPIHYAELTRLGLRRIGAIDADEFRCKEDVREKMLLAGLHGSFYSGKPEFVAAMADWFPLVQQPLFNRDCELLVVPGSASRAYDACYELAMRCPYMQTKHAATEARYQGMARGLVIQTHICGYFKDRWPMFYREPNNFQIWTKPCDHDFQLAINDQVYRVDVMGPIRAGGFSLMHKRPTDLHIVGDIVGDNVAIRGFVSGKNAPPQFIDEETMPISRLVVWLSCLRDGIDYKRLWDRSRTVVLA